MSAIKPFIHPTAIVENGARIGNGVRIWHFCHIRSSAVIGEGVSIGKDVYIDLGVNIGEGTRIQNGVSVYSGIKIAPWCFIGPNVVFTNDLTPRAGTKKWNVIETILETGASLGAGSVIRCGITIGAFAMVGAGAILTKSVPSFHLTLGVPSRVCNKICACGKSILPLDTPDKDLIRSCCRQNLEKEVLELAKEILFKKKALKL